MGLSEGQATLKLVVDVHADVGELPSSSSGSRGFAATDANVIS